MLRYVYGRDAAQFPALFAQMHRDRAAQFRDRLGWDVQVDAQGQERDSYDHDDALYVIWQMTDGAHGGSMRFLPTAGQTMVNDHFAHILPKGPVRDPRIWECTRFCLAPHAPSRVAAALMLAGGEVMRAHRLEYLLGVFDARMVRIYQRIGAAPQVLGASGQGRDRISIGLWPFRPMDRLSVLQNAGVSSRISEYWFARSLGWQVNRPIAA